MSTRQSSTSFNEVGQLIWQYIEDRDWNDNTARGLAISIALESAELLEHFQWTDQPVGNKQAVADELADVLIYAFQFAQVMDIDMIAAISHKLQTALKYPAKNFKGRSRAEKRQAWANSKPMYRKNGANV